MKGRSGYLINPVAQRAVLLVAEGVGAVPLTGTAAEAVALVRTRTAGQALLETVAMQLLLHGLRATGWTLAPASGALGEAVSCGLVEVRE